MCLSMVFMVQMESFTVSVKYSEMFFSWLIIPIVVEETVNASRDVPVSMPEIAL